MRYARGGVLLMVAMMAGAAGCQRLSPNGGAGKSPFIEGRAEVVEVNNELGTAVLKIDGKRVDAYWDTEPRTAVQTDAPLPGTAFGAPTARVREPVTRPQIFPAQPGDTIGYRGLMTGKELLLRAVAVLPK